MLAFVAVLPTVWGIKQFAEHGVDWPPVAGVVGGLVFLTVFVWRQRRLADPVIDVRLFRAPAFSAAVVMNVLANFALVGFMFFISQYLQLVLGLRRSPPGLWSLPAAAAAGIGAAVLAPMLAQRFRRAYVAAGGLLVAAAGCLVLAQVGDAAGLAQVVVGQALMTGGVAMVLTLSAELIVSTAPPERAGAAAGLSETGSRVGCGARRRDPRQHRHVRLPAATLRRGTGRVPADSWATARETLGGAVEESRGLATVAADTLVALARAAFAAELRVAAVVAAGILLVTAVLAAVLLRNVGASVPGQDTSGGSTTRHPVGRHPAARRRGRRHRCRRRHGRRRACSGRRGAGRPGRRGRRPPPVACPAPGSGSDRSRPLRPAPGRPTRWPDRTVEPGVAFPRRGGNAAPAADRLHLLTPLPVPRCAGCPLAALGGSRPAQGLSRSPGVPTLASSVGAGTAASLLACRPRHRRPGNLPLRACPRRRSPEDQ